ncbi:hypothetical protein BCR36DRAFT_372460 [Piromyces finnis]|uniref:DUF4515 domain-containing protein n=1 Tax=Piromyces finnis TaxID=1754191 RepID=A0A1Y1V3Z2_9FUNG|nr:hypothetical protein BCR36DRAFT_372460 [Piromyces finnis]|eukprot:ORX45971.1 hypothetical protein BCR36DRAFT_372460 [Piromyces finnis]
MAVKNKDSSKGKSKKSSVSTAASTTSKVQKDVVIPKQTLSKIIPLKSDLRIEDLDEDVLKERLELLNKELNYYKEKCKSLKFRNEKLKNEIEENKKDTTDYVKYLEESKNKKQKEIDNIIEKANEEFQLYLRKKQERKHDYDKKYEEIESYIADLEVKIEAKKQEIKTYSDIQSNRLKHESEIDRLTININKIKQEHELEISNLERQLLQNRVKIQKETEQTIKNMEAVAQEKASKYLNEYISMLDKDNERLEEGLAMAIKTTDQLMEEKNRLERENQALRHENKYRDSIASIRLKRINNAIENKKKTDIRHSADENLQKKEKLLKLLSKDNEITPELIEFVNNKLKWDDNEYRV